jgi:hypothetical protein
MPTYKAIQREVRITSGLVPKTCEIAHVLELLGQRPRIAPNRINPNVRRYPCPTEKQAAIVEALRKLEDVRPRRSSL